MADNVSSIPNWITPMIILTDLSMSVCCFYFGWIYTGWANAQEFVFVQIGAVALLFTTLMLILGVYARRAGYTREELDTWGDDALSGKPPI